MPVKNQVSTGFDVSSAVDRCFPIAGLNLIFNPENGILMDGRFTG
jgi:hypothetical protein